MKFVLGNISYEHVAIALVIIIFIRVALQGYKNTVNSKSV